MRTNISAILASATLALSVSCALATPASAGGGNDCGGGSGDYGCYTSLKAQSFGEQATYTGTSWTDTGVYFLDKTSGGTLSGFNFTLNDTGQSTGLQPLFEIYDTQTPSYPDNIKVTFNFDKQSFTATGTLEYASGKDDLIWDNGGVFDFGNLEVDLTGGNFNTSYTSSDHTYPAELVKANFTLAPCGAVPEPATWAMMMLGFFGMGGVLRSRRKALVLAA